MATNYYGSLNSSGEDQSKGSGDFYIGGVNFGKKWSDKDAAALQHYQLQASIEQQLEEREYNSPAAQAQRMRAAGLNPDMQDYDNGNSSVSAGVGSPSGESASAQNARTAQTIHSMIELLPQAVSQIQGFRTQSLDNAIKEESIRKYADELAVQRLADYTQLSDYTGDEDYVLAVPYYDIKNRSVRKAFKNALDMYSINSSQVKSKVYERESKLAASKFDYATKYVKSGSSQSDDLLISAVKELYDIEQKALKASGNASASRDNYTKEFYDNKDGSTDASYDTATRRKNSQNTLDSVFDDELVKLWDTNPSLAAVIYLARAFVSGASSNAKTVADVLL